MIGRRRLLILVTLAALLGAHPDASAAAKKRRRPARTSKRAVVRRPPAPPAVVLGDPTSVDDAAVGEACRRGLGSIQGAVVAMDPHTGRVIAVVNPALGVERAYQPCSVFKIVVAMAGLPRASSRPQTTYNCRGGCWLWPGHGPIDLRRALAVSCNPYFEWVGEQLGYEKVQRYARLLGLGTPSGHQPGAGDRRAPSRCSCRRVARGTRLEPCEGHHHVRRAARRAALGDHQRRRHLPAAARGPVGFVPQRRWRLPETTVWRAWPTASWARSTKAAPRPRSTRT